MLEALAAQAAVSLENSKLFLSVVAKNMELLETKDLSVVGKNMELLETKEQLP